MRNSHTIAGFVLAALIIGGIIFIASRKRTVGVRLVKPGKTSSGPLVRYRNIETREIEWNEDGLPVKIIIHRESTQLP